MNTQPNHILERARQRPPRGEPAAGGKAAPALRQRIGLLRREDQILVELAMSGTASRRRMGELLGLQPGTVTRRLQRLAARLHDPIVIRLLDPRCGLSPEQRQIGAEHFLTGLTVAELAAKHGLSRERVRVILGFLREWHRGTRGAGPPAANPSNGDAHH
ncbi:MAG TPA: sigma factor-like helix-turn-helix DNA-binding protein [Tepidisphaeraceae bacterium]|nr:sigma factor-like helix-turn-helix DNA-binding protein [Tepidisphaeraceae bacterium]